jgi:predicted Zn-dependent protease
MERQGSANIAYLFESIKMKTATLPLSLALVLASATATSAQAQNNAPHEGVQVGKMSFMRNFAPTGALEQQAAQQYAATLQQAAQQRALGTDDMPQVMRLRAIAKRLIPFALSWNARAQNWKWEVNLLGSKQINAYCMPGGKIAFYTGILDSLKLTDDEVAIVMGHEMAHALREHGVERAGKQNVVNGVLKLGEMFAAAKGYDPNLVGAYGGGFANLAMLKFSRDDETEADVVGLDIAARAGFDPRAGIALWQKMALINKSAPPQWLSTHPAGENRIEEIHRHLPEVMPLYARTRSVMPGSLPPYKSNVKGLTPIS